MGSFLTAIPLVAYWLIVVIWTIIVVILIGKLRGAPRRHQAVSLLVLVLAVDASRTLFENLYFGAYWSALYGALPATWRAALENPVLVALPKLVNVVAGLLVLFLLIRRWLPADELARVELERSVRHSRAAAAQAETKYQRLVETSLDVICTVDEQGRFVDVSPRCRDVWGYEPEEMVGHPFTDFVHPEDRACAEAEAAAIMRGVSAQFFEDRHFRKDGSIVHIMWSAVWSAADGLIYAVGRDVTRRHHRELRRQELEDKLRQSQRLESVGQLTGGIAHDFNNLLTVVIGNTEAVLQRTAGDPQTQALAATTRAAAQRGAELISRLLAFSRRQPLEPHPVDANTLVTGVRALLDSLLGGNIEIRVALATGGLPILVDPPQLEAALVNLCVNARDAMPHGGELKLATEHLRLDAEDAAQDDLTAGEYAVIRVSDTGTGMTAEIAARVFEPFFTTKETGKGSGLGLSMVYGFVKQSGGHIRVESVLGRGTTVTMLFPRSPEAVQAAAPASASAAIADLGAAMAQGGTETILLVEDNDMIRDYVVTTLGDLGYRVVVAANGPEGLAALRERADIDLLFSDLLLPGGLNGRQLAVEARKLHPRLKVLLTSGYPEAIGPGEPVLRKPYGKMELAQAVRGALAR